MSNRASKIRKWQTSTPRRPPFNHHQSARKPSLQTIATPTLTSTVSLLQHPDLLRRLHTDQGIDFNAISPHIHSQGSARADIRRHGYLCGDGHCCVFHVCVCVHACRCILERCEESECKVHRGIRVGFVFLKKILIQGSTDFCLSARYVHGSLNTSTDLLIAALPVRGIWRLRLVRRQRIALIAILTLGWL
jgi:hypothetical protein